MFFGKRKTVVGNIAGDDLAARTELGSHDRAQTHCAAAGDEDRRVSFGTQAVQNGTGAGLDAAAHGRSELDGDIVVDMDQVVLMHDGVRSKRALPEKGGNRFTFVGNAFGAVKIRAEEIQCSIGTAGERTAAAAHGTRSAVSVGEANLIALFEIRYAFSDAQDDARALVPEHDRECKREKAEPCHFIRVTDAARFDLDEDFSLFWRRKLGGVDRQSAGFLTDDCCFDFHHTSSPFFYSEFVLQKGFFYKVIPGNAIRIAFHELNCFRILILILTQSETIRVK